MPPLIAFLLYSALARAAAGFVRALLKAVIAYAVTPIFSPPLSFPRQSDAMLRANDARARK